MDVPGVRAENIQIEIENDVLTVSGERPFPYAREDGTGPARRVERGFGRFQRGRRCCAAAPACPVLGITNRNT
jgi:HSP20 family molecular chaperone IbpA